MNRTTLQQEIDSAIGAALQAAWSDGSWRTYAGKHQAGVMGYLGAMTGCEHVGLTASATAALELLLQALALPEGSEVMLAGYDYPGNFSAVERSGLRPVLVDIEANSWALCFDSLQQTWSPDCKVLVASHLHGQLQDIDRLRNWCESRNVRLIQDACQVLGATSGGRPLAPLAHATIYSFGGSKTISAGRGGAWVTSDASWAQHVRLAGGAGSGTCEMSELQAAVIAAQLPFLDRITHAARTFFGQVQESIQSTQAAMISPWRAQLNDTAFYQAGWICHDEPQRAQLDQLLTQRLTSLFEDRASNCQGKDGERGHGEREVGEGERVESATPRECTSRTRVRLPGFSSTFCASRENIWSAQEYGCDCTNDGGRPPSPCAPLPCAPLPWARRP